MRDCRSRDGRRSCRVRCLSRWRRMRSGWREGKSRIRLLGGLGLRGELRGLRLGIRMAGGMWWGMLVFFMCRRSFRGRRRRGILWR
ncbi:uncharacterized protein BDW47DRAFT_98962 [Aspergillus candidus]|uniref:Uncharacterized protein n=1 Tax=Aspergillus candidus TaxID=41067 RepID=A0A2I2FN10_ASPCN|nr:hypothetical protein BDW47DRAFT_98962 [Aspergillus candidus]PLB42001.1 hypothetical protein BDW47DRAFT_98962 [Aspergillus candidus]